MYAGPRTDVRSINIILQDVSAFFEIHTYLRLMQLTSHTTKQVSPV